MNEDRHDRDLEEAVALLRTIQPSSEARQNNQMVVASELKRLQARSAPVSWWKKSVSVPVPVAIGLGILACSVPWVVRFSVESNRQPDTALNRSALDVETDSDSHATEQVKATYLCGVGLIERETFHWHQEQK